MNHTMERNRDPNVFRAALERAADDEDYADFEPGRRMSLTFPVENARFTSSDQYEDRSTARKRDRQWREDTIRHQKSEAIRFRHAQMPAAVASVAPADPQRECAIRARERDRRWREANKHRSAVWRVLREAAEP